MKDEREITPIKIKVYILMKKNKPSVGLFWKVSDECFFPHFILLLVKKFALMVYY